MQAIMRTTGVAVWSVLSCAALAGAAESPSVGQDGVDRQAAMTGFLAQHPEARLAEANGRITRVYGAELGGGSDPESAAEAFRRRHVAIFGVSAEDLDPRGPLADGRHTQPVMFDKTTGTYKFTLVYYTQWKSGMPVFRADLRLLFRNEPGSPLVLAANGLRALGSWKPDAAAARDSSKGIEAAKKAVPGLVQFTAPKPVIWAGVDDEVVAPSVAYEFVGMNSARLAEADQKWLFVADAVSGEILYKENRIIDVDVVGNVSGLVTQGPGAEQCEPEVLTDFPYARVNIGSTVAFADTSGDFVIPNGGTAAVTVQSAVRGQWFRVFNWPSGEPDTVLSQSVIPPGPANFTHNASNTELLRAEANGYVHTNVVRDFTLVYNPSYPTLTQTEFPVYVNRTDGFCPGNAWYDPADVSLNFCQSGGGFPNTAWTSVIYHEYGHHLVEAGGSGQGEYGEGMGDVMSVLILDVPELGIGFFGSCAPSAALRNADNTCQYVAGSCSTCGSEIHDCGQLLSGCVWDTRNALAVTNPGSYIDILAGLAVNAILLHGGSSIAPDITVDYLTLDDDDANINNGTPHAAEICSGFGAHNMDCPAFDPIGFSYPNGRPDLVVPNETTDIRVDVVSIGGTPIPGTGTVSHRIGTSGGFSTVPMTELVANEYVATLPGADCGETIQYYFSANAVGGSTFTDPPGAPSTTFSATAATALVPIVSYDFETNPGWTVSGSVSDGQWNRGIPVNCARGDPPADYDGSGQCWLTDNSAAGGCNSDVDGGTTTLTTQAINLSGLVDPRVTYARWYSNTEGASPEADIFEVEISGNNGSTWVDLETVGPTGPEVDGGWYVRSFRVADFVTPGAQTRLRFHASDLGLGSIVEAAVDAFSIEDVVCAPCSDPCDDGDACTINDVCTGPFACEGTPVDCSGVGDQCNAASCDPNGVEGNCDVLTPVANGTPCNDGAACTVGDTCQTGICAGGQPPDCSGFGDQCNVASCAPGGADGNCDVVTPVPNGTGCDDSDPCNVGETCQSGSCTGGGPPDCSGAGDECNTASCDSGGAPGNCDVLTPVIDGTSCDGGLGICTGGECVPDPGDNRVFMAASGEQVLAAPGGPTSLTMAPGSTATIEVWAADTEPQLLNGYQIAIPGAATPTSGTGSVTYVDTPGVGGSVTIDVDNPDWIFFPDPSVAPFYSETGLPAGFAMLASLPFGQGTALSGLAYLGEFQVQASTDACGTFTLGFIPDGQPPNGGSGIVDNTGSGQIYAFYQPLVITVAAPNDACTNAIALSGDDVTVGFTTVCSGQDGANHGCGAIGDDIWYAYTATCTGDLTVSTESGCAFDTAVAVYDAEAGCVPGDAELDQCADVPGACETIETTVAEGETVLIRVGSVAGQTGSGTLTLTCVAACTVVEDCGDVDANGIIDDACTWYACDTGVCNETARVFADAGGAFGACPPDGFANVHDHNHALACFAGTNTCDALNLDVGGPFGDCAPDGFCNIHDANHALAAFAGTTTCTCPPSPSPAAAPPIVGQATLMAVPRRATVKPGDTVVVDVFVSGALDDLRSYQLATAVSGGRRGSLDLVDVALDGGKGFAFAGRADSFSAYNVEAGRMLAGLRQDGMTVPAGAHLATFTYRVSRSAAGAFVVEVLAGGANESFLIASHDGRIAIEKTVPGVVMVTSGDPVRSSVGTGLPLRSEAR